VEADRPRPAAHRSGDNATSAVAQGAHPKIALGDINDLYAYVRRIAVPLALNPEEIEDLVAEGVTLAYERHLKLSAGQSLSSALSFWLESRLRDHRRTQHREWRRNSRAGTSYSQPVATGLAWEHEDTSAGMPLVSDAALTESRLHLEILKRQEDLYDPRLTGRLRGIPSSAAIATGQAQEIWALIDQERGHTASAPPLFAFKPLEDR